MSMQSHLQAIGLVQYTQTLQGHGFETWQDLIGIIESDFEQMGMLRGHRRKLQRALHLSLASENGTCSSITSTYKEQRRKRQYRRHPKRDLSTPPRPKSAYQLFANNVRQRMQDHGMTFVELAKFIGTRWSLQSPDERNTWTSTASKAKTQYQERLSLYETTPQYLQHKQYLQDFKNQQKHSLEVQRDFVARNKVTSHVKKPSEPRKDVANLEPQTTPQQQEQVTACATEGNTRYPEIDQCDETKHSSPASLRTGCWMPNCAVSNDGDDEIRIEDCARKDPSMSTTTTQSEVSQYFRMVLHL